MTNHIIEETLKDLEELPGLTKFKGIVKEIGMTARAGELSGKPVNFAFIGNPGTGKVALARLVGEMLYRLQVLRKDQLFGVHKSDLTGQSSQETIQRVNGLIEKARGGIVYVDKVPDILALGKEVIQVMLDARETMIVLSGTREELAALLADAEVSPKINFRLEFPDYTPEELMEVAVRLAEDYQLTITREAAEKLQAIFLSRQHELGKLGNTRYAKDIIDKAYRRAASRIMTGGETDKLFPEDIEG
ncbi:AAA family ATPase [Desulforamulus putei]|uniref:Stage V sporulation protein K n=1 Tax=Desulforamulus putei DSM 12395 TaxID=1121429 RepID=A0A1M4XL60_9FIRM|nr:AAA family ATPase [Desulforamulus putei]SHE94171.1 stage V sporulation protein K [Desulforamulus putei DSM 12395]